MAVPIVALAPVVADLIKDVVSRIRGKRIDEEEARRIDLTLQEMAQRGELQQLEQFVDLVKAQLQAVRTGPYAIFAAIGDMMRLMVRPLVTYSWMALYAYLKVNIVLCVTADGFQPQDAAAIFNGYDAMVGLTILTFWFGSKAVERVLEQLAQGRLSKIFGLLGR
ncbi:MAG: hypothetical protein DRO18_00880 [Thermoprotei archaeon]|nr:MAG: hypothetical protein DRO18_00880 [Thermoprotei archaeon]